MNTEWVAVTDRMPEPGEKVLAAYVSYGKRCIVCAEWIPEKFEEVTPSDDNYVMNDYDEEKDTYYLPKGWYELLENHPDYTSIRVSGGIVRYWMPMPPHPMEAV